MSFFRPIQWYHSYADLIKFKYRINTDYVHFLNSRCMFLKEMEVQHRTELRTVRIYVYGLFVNTN
jgi:hypothetical protein